MACGTALTMIYDGQRGTVWLAAATFDSGAFPHGVGTGQAQHICVAYASCWNPPSRWPSDGLHRVRGVFEGDRVRLSKEAGDMLSADIRQVLSKSSHESSGISAAEDEELQEALVLSKSSHESSGTSAGEDEELQEALVLSKSSHESSGTSAAVDEELQEALRRSLLHSRGPSSPFEVDQEAQRYHGKTEQGDLHAGTPLKPAAAPVSSPETIANLCQAVGCGEAEAAGALASSNGDANVAAALLLSQPRPATALDKGGSAASAVEPDEAMVSPAFGVKAASTPPRKRHCAEASHNESVQKLELARRDISNPPSSAATAVPEAEQS